MTGRRVGIARRRPAVLRTAAMLAGSAAMLGASPFAHAGSGDADVEFLIGRVEQSSCTFERNGSAYRASEAASHLRRKLAAAPGSFDAQKFIDRIAAGSSLSGRPYLVRCAGQDPKTSSAWLREQLLQRGG